MLVHSSKATHHLSNHYKKLDTPDNGLRKPMHYEENRITSYTNWPVTFIEPTNLAKAGFYFTHKEDIVRCAFCNVEIGRWEEGDDVMSDHRRFSENCPIVQGTPCGNIPMSESSGNNALSTTLANGGDGGHDTCGKYGVQLRPHSYPENDEPLTSVSTATTGSGNGPATNPINLNKLGIPPSRGPAYPTYGLKEKRILSFADWPVSLKQTPAELSEAGFYYTGKGDQTVCFYCGGGLKDWEENDLPWEQHARWFSKCNFVLLQKGQDYINKICSKEDDPVITPKQAEELSVPNTSSKSVKTNQLNEASSSISKKTSTNNKIDDKTKDSDETATSKATLCKICYTKEVGVVFLPCGHMVACVDCAPALSKCAVCRSDLEATVRAFLS